MNDDEPPDSHKVFVRVNGSDSITLNGETLSPAQAFNRIIQYEAVQRTKHPTLLQRIRQYRSPPISEQEHHALKQGLEELEQQRYQEGPKIYPPSTSSLRKR